MLRQTIRRRLTKKRYTANRVKDEGREIPKVLMSEEEAKQSVAEVWAAIAKGHIKMTPFFSDRVDLSRPR